MIDVIEIIVFSMLGGIVGAKIGVRRAQGDSWATIIEAGVKWCFDIVVGTFHIIRNAFRKCLNKDKKAAKEDEVNT